VSNNNCQLAKKNLHKIFKTELYLFWFVLLTLLTAGIHFKFKRLGFCNLLLIKWVSSLEHDIKVTKNHQNLLPTQSVLLAHTVGVPSFSKMFSLQCFQCQWSCAKFECNGHTLFYGNEWVFPRFESLIN
jgi:hypothetical protein